VLGLIATRSFDGKVLGINELVSQAELRVRSGMIAYDAMQKLRATPGDQVLRGVFQDHVKDLGYALLLKRYTPAVTDATPAQIRTAAADTVPPVAPLFWTFRIMAGLGFYFIALFAWAFWLSARRGFERSRLFQRVALWSMPLPWIAAELGWYVAETGRQPWTIDGVLPTFLSASSTSAANVWVSLVVFTVFYSALAVIDVMLMLRTVRAGPEGLAPPPPIPSAAQPAATGGVDAA
jgi:cytochrome d ubiquinol oxidase subunit I